MDARGSERERSVGGRVPQHRGAPPWGVSARGRTRLGRGDATGGQVRPMSWAILPELVMVGAGEMKEFMAGSSPEPVTDPQHGEGLDVGDRRRESAPCGDLHAVI